jgi:hypothetical protein
MTTSRPSLRTVLLVGLAMALLVAGILSSYASSAPDGLERVAADTGLEQVAAGHPADASPLAGYEVRGVDNPRLSGGLAGVVGTLTVLMLAGGLFVALRRRPPGRR